MSGPQPLGWVSPAPHNLPWRAVCVELGPEECRRVEFTGTAWADAGLVQRLRAKGYIDVPEGALLRSMTYQPRRGSWLLVFEHDSLDAVRQETAAPQTWPVP